MVMWKSLVVPRRCPGLWQEYAWRRGKLASDTTVTGSDGRAISPFYMLEGRSFSRLFCGGYGCPPLWLRADAIGGLRGGARAAIADKEGEEEEKEKKKRGEMVVNMLAMEDLVLPSPAWAMSGRCEASHGSEPIAVDVRALAGDAGLEPGQSEDRDLMHPGVSKRESVGSRMSSHWNILTGPAEYRRRKTVSDPLNFRGNGRGPHCSLREFSHRAASETYLITRLAFTLLKLLGIGTRWIGKFIRLSLYAVFLMPGFIQVGYFYYFDERIHRSIIYGDQPRNRFDLYLPPDNDKPKPVVIFITGGAWVIGYKAWGSLLAQQLVERDVIVACIDYRNFPQGCISDMISDVSTGIGYVYQNIENYGGDPNMVYLAGQSAGAHLAACALLMQAEKEIIEDPAKLAWRSSQIKAYMSISGGYNLIKLVEYFHARGLYKSIMLRVMEGEKSLPIYSPEYIVKTPTFKKSVPLLPPITLFHGTGDYSIPHEASEAFAAALQSVGAQVNTVLYPDKTHTDLFLQDPMRGGKDELLADILAVVHANDEEARAEDVKNAHFRRRLVPEILLQLARRVSPF